MKVALVVPGGVDRGGAERVIPCVLWLIERLARKVELHVFALYQEPRPSVYPLLGATVHNVGARPVRPRALGMILREHARGRFDVFHAMWANPPGVIAAIAGRLLGRPALLHLAGGELVAIPEIGYGSALSARGRFWVRRAIRGAAVVTAASGPMIAAAAAVGCTARRLPLGVDLTAWPPREPRRRPGTRPARLLHVAGLNRVKDQTTLLNATRGLVDLGVDFMLDIVGEDAVNGEAQHLAQQFQLERWVRFRGFLPQQRLRPLVESADLLVLSSLHEAGPIVMLEAAAAGVPTVGTAVGHVVDWAPDAAVAVPRGDAAALANAVADLLRNEDRRLNIAREAQRRAITEDADWTAAQVESIYAQLTSRTRKAR